jgi:hypothetical protein
MRQRLQQRAEGEIAVLVHHHHALVPAVVLLDRLMHRQRVEEFVGEDDGGAFRHLFQRLVPEDWHAVRLQGLRL